MELLKDGWRLNIERGPGWLFLKLAPAEGRSSGESLFSDEVWDAAERHFTYRVVLDLADIAQFGSALIGDLVELERRLQEQHGTLRLCGLNDECRELLEAAKLPERLPAYPSRADAVWGISRFDPPHHPK